MAGKVALGFSFFVQGDGTTDPIAFDIREHPFFTFPVSPIATFSNNDNLPPETLSYPVSTAFDILKNPPTGITVGSYSIISNVVTFEPGTNQYTAVLSGYEITVTPNAGFTSGILQVLGVVTFD